MLPRDADEIGAIEGNNRVSASIDSGSKNHLVVRVAKNWPPTSRQSNLNAGGTDRIKQFPNFTDAESGGLQMLSTS